MRNLFLLICLVIFSSCATTKEIHRLKKSVIIESCLTDVDGSFQTFYMTLMTTAVPVSKEDLENVYNLTLNNQSCKPYIETSAFLASTAKLMRLTIDIKYSSSSKEIKQLITDFHKEKKLYDVYRNNLIELRNLVRIQNARLWE